MFIGVVPCSRSAGACVVCCNMDMFKISFMKFHH